MGDKLSAIDKLSRSLAPDGLLVASFDASSVRDQDGEFFRKAIASLRAQGFEYNSRSRLLRRSGPCRLAAPWRYLGADDTAGPNYTGQPAVNSFYGNLTT